MQGALTKRLADGRLERSRVADSSSVGDFLGIVRPQAFDVSSRGFDCDHATRSGRHLAVCSVLESGVSDDDKFTFRSQIFRAQATNQKK